MTPPNRLYCGFGLLVSLAAKLHKNLYSRISVNIFEAVDLDAEK